jgi:hypothetical protein
MRAIIIVFTINFWIGTAIRLHHTDNSTLRKEYQEMKANMPFLGAVFTKISLENKKEYGLFTHIKTATKKAKQYKWLIGLLGFGTFWQLIKWRKKVLKMQSKREGDYDTRGCLKVGCIVLGGAALLGYIIGLLFPTTVGFVAYMIGLGLICIFAIIFSGKLK